MSTTSKKTMLKADHLRLVWVSIKQGVNIVSCSPLGILLGNTIHLAMEDFEKPTIPQTHRGLYKRTIICVILYCCHFSQWGRGSGLMNEKTPIASACSFCTKANIIKVLLLFSNSTKLMKVLIRCDGFGREWNSEFISLRLWASVRILNENWWMQYFSIHISRNKLLLILKTLVKAIFSSIV